MKRLHAYLQRIAYGGPLSPNRNTLHNLHRAHLLAIPFENIDVQRGVTPSLDVNAVFDKLVTNRRGGWCFEMNGLLAWALREIGFTVDLVAASVERKRRGDDAALNHLALIVHLDEPILADVGFGCGMLVPIPLREGTHNDTRFDFRLTRDGDWWRFHNHRYDPMTYDFTETPVTLESFAEQNAALAVSPESSFVTNLTCMRLSDDGIRKLTNGQFQRFGAAGIEEQIAPNAAALERLLREEFDLQFDGVDTLWPRIAEQHRRMLQKKIRGF